MLAIYIILGFIVFLILLLCIPVETTILVNTESSNKYSLMISWLFGIVNKDLVKRKPSQKKKRKKSGGKKGLSFRLGIDIVSQIVDYAGLLHQVKDFLLSIFRQLSIKQISGDVVVGLEDPAYTGILFAVVGPANALLNLHPKYDVSIRPFFNDENILLGNLNGNVKVRPIRLICPALKLVVSKEVRQMGNKYIKEKWANIRKND